MLKLILLNTIIVSSSVFANLVEFKANDSIKAAEVNNNFSYIKTLLSNKNIQVNFDSFNSGELILTETFENEFDKLRLLGITIDPLVNPNLKSADLNRAFTQSKNGATEYNDIPTSFNSSLSTIEDSSYLGTLGYSNIVGEISASIVSSPANGSLTLNGLNYSYTPNLNYFGSDSFSFRVFDGTHYSEPATISISINAVNDAPMANSQSLTTNEDTNLNITLIGIDIESSPLTYEVISQPSKGVLSGSGFNLTYIPNQNSFGADSFTFKVNDGALDSASATVNIDVVAVNDAPTISGSSTLNVNQNSSQSGSVSGSDVENSLITYSLYSAPTKGSVVIGSNGNYTYTTNTNTLGSDSFSIRSFDGALYSDPLVINVEISGSGIILDAGVRTYFDGTVADSCNQYLTQNSGNYTYTGQTGSGKYRIKPQSSVTTTYDVDCDMVSEGGGWTKINAQTASAVTGSFNANQQMVVSNLPSTNCSPGPFSMRINNIKVPYSKIRMDMTRGSTIVQCATLSKYATASSIVSQGGYVDSTNLVSWSMCTWSDNVWAKSQGNVSSSGLRSNWRLIGNKDPDSSGVSFYSTCSYSGDNGSITATWFVK